jgi:hypothetical protein
LLQNIVKSDPEPNNIKIAIDAWDKVAAYTEPKLKAVEIKGDEDNPLIVSQIERTLVKVSNTDC